MPFLYTVNIYAERNGIGGEGTHKMIARNIDEADAFLIAALTPDFDKIDILSWSKEYVLDVRGSV